MGSYWAIVFMSLAQVIGGIPVLIDTWKNPIQEKALLGYTGFLSIYILTLCVAPVWNIPYVFFPIVMGTSCLLIVLTMIKGSVMEKLKKTAFRNDAAFFILDYTAFRISL